MLVDGGVALSAKPNWIEGQHLSRRDGRNYLTAAEGGTEAGHAELVEAQTGAWWAAFLAVRPYAGDNAPVYLKIDARGSRYECSYANRPGAWTALVRDADGTILSSRTACGFIGVTLGLFAYAAP